MIIDGGNRAAACYAAGVEPRYVEFAGGNLVAFVLSANLHRRHLSPDRPRRLWRLLRTGRRRSRRTALKRVPRGTLINRYREVGTVWRQRTHAAAGRQGGRGGSRTGQTSCAWRVSLPAAVAKVEGREKPTPETKPAMISEDRAAEITAERRSAGANRRDRA